MIPESHFSVNQVDQSGEFPLPSDYTEKELERQAQRIHKLADTVQSHEGKLIEHTALISQMQGQLTTIISTMASRELLNATAGQMLSKIEQFHSEANLRLNSFEDQLSPIKKGIYWAIGLILAAVVTAILNLVLKH